MKKIVLAYSGGLDTSCAIPWLKTRGYEVICFMADVGQGKELKSAQSRAYKSGAKKVVVKDLRKEFVQDFVLPALRAGAVYQGKYLLATALSRPLIAKYLVSTAHESKATAISHGCTGKGNDQVRLETAAAMLDGKLKVIAPLREWEFKSREEEIAYAKKMNIVLGVTKAKPYSIDSNLWGVSIEGGKLEDLDVAPEEDCFVWTKVKPKKGPMNITISFDKGVPVALNNRSMPVINIIESLNRTGSQFRIGRTDLVEDRLVGIKSREIYEAPAGWLLHQAHLELESLTLDKLTRSFKSQVSSVYAQLVYDGLWFSPLKKALDGFIEQTQVMVTGSIVLELSDCKFKVKSRKSKFSRYHKSLATYSQGDEFDHQAAEGFIKLWAMPYKKIE